MASNSAVDDKVGQGHADGYRNGGERAAPAHGERKGNGEHRHDDGNERIGELVPQGDAQAHGVKSALAQIADVAVELAEVHLLRLQIFLFKVAGVFVNLGEVGLSELAIAGDVSAPVMSRTQPFSKAPGVRYRGPRKTRAAKIRRDERERGRIKLEDGKIGKLLAVRIEELVVENASRFAGVRLAEDPVVLGMRTVCGGRPLMMLRKASCRRLAWGR